MFILRNKQIHEAFIEWIKARITKFLLLCELQWWPPKAFSLVAEIKTMDPFSPCLFVVVIEFVTRMMKDVVLERKIKYHICFSKADLVCLSVTDDLMILLERDGNSLLAIFDISDEFHSLSGQSQCRQN